MAKPRNKRSLTIARHRTSVSLEEPFWMALCDIAKAQGKSIASLVNEIDKGRGERSQASLSAAIRLYVLEQARGVGGST
ncbi:MAG: ribbon-helix-helix domain-containing protein [Methyloceanibacter sp.]|uniref:ribbon-helix-helix domain-containing protein n=1 Tax=Methyloceanibacter sp. TaxID=1965321 RepID=UPI003D6CBAA7